MRNHTYLIPKPAFDVLLPKLEKVRARAQKCVEVRAIPVEFHKEPWVRVEVLHDYSDNGWRLLGALRHLEGTDEAVVWDENIPVKFWSRGPACDHCPEKGPRKRKYTYVLQNEHTGQIVQVGTSCVSEYTGEASASLLSFLRSLEYIDKKLREPQGWGQWRDSKASVLLTVTAAIDVIRAFGFRSAKKQPESGVWRTFELAQQAAWYYECNPETIRFSEDAERDAQVCIDHWLENAGQRTFDQNIKAWCTAGYHPRYGDRNDEPYPYAHLAAAVLMWMREIGEAPKPETTAKVSGGFFGQLGKRMSFNAQITGVFGPYSGDFGAYHLVKAREVTTGAELVWFRSGEVLPLWLANAEDSEESVYLRGTPKDHTVYKGRKQTKLTRVSAVT